MDRYEPLKIEEKWQKIWDEEKAYKVEIDKNKEKFYALVEFPYPSGQGLHVGHPVLIPHLMLSLARNVCRDLMFCIRWGLTLSDCLQKIML